MKQKPLEDAVKQYPGKIKQDSNSTLSLTKGITALAKAQLLTQKETGSVGMQLASIDQTKEVSKNFDSVYKVMRTSYQTIQEEQQNKSLKLKEWIISANELVKEVSQLAKDVADNKASQTGISMLERDFQRIQKHKKMFSDFLFLQMKEHAKLLEQYSLMFEETQKRINVASEFKDVIIMGGKFNPTEVNEYLQTKVSRSIAQDLKAAFTGSAGQPRSQSQQRAGPQQMQMSNDRLKESQQSQQRGRSQAPAQPETRGQ